MDHIDLAMGDPIEDKIIHLDRWQRKNINLGRISPERMGGAGHLPALLQRFRRNSSSAGTFSIHSFGLVKGTPLSFVGFNLAWHLSYRLLYKLAGTKSGSKDFTSSRLLANLEGP